MALSNKIEISTAEDLTVTEVQLSGVVLRAAAFHLGKYCESYNNEFMLCREETQDVSACLSEGQSVTRCTLDFFRMVKNKCAEEFTKYYTCIDRGSSDYKFQPCRKTQKSFDECMLKGFDIQRPEYGYFCRARVHTTDRPKPEEEVLEFDASAIPQSLPEDYLPDRPKAKYGKRDTMGF